MPDNNSDKIEAQLQSLAESDDLVKWLSDVDISKHIADWLVEDYGFSRFQVMAGLRIVTPIILSCGKSAGKLMADGMKQRLISRIKRVDWIKNFIEKLEDLQSKTDQQIEGENSLKERLEGRVDRFAGDIEHRKALSLDLQAHLSQMDMLDEIKNELECIKGLLIPQPVFKRIFASNDERGRFIYRSQYIPFVGREKELNFLNDFLKDERRVCWHSIVGPGGIGKSRLGLEFCLRNGGAYRAGILHDIKFKFEEWVPSQPTLIVIDYATQYEKRLKEVLDHLSNQEDIYEYNVRILILDRDSADSKLNDLHEDSYLKDSAYSGEPYSLHEVDTEIAEAVLEFFYEAEGRTPPEGWDDHVEKLKEIDPLMRPLFAAYFAEAVAKGGCGRECSRESLLLDVIRREEKKFWKPCGVTEKDLALLALATMIGGISTENNFTLPECVTPFQELIHAKNRFKALNCMVVEDPETSQKIQVLPPWEPDLVGELFVLDFLKDDVDTGVNRYRRDMLNAAWDNASFATATFLDRCRQDYFDHTGYDALVVQPDQLNQGSALLWAMLSVNLIDSYGEARRFNRAEELYADLKDLSSSADSTPEIILRHAKAAFNLINDYGEARKFDRAEALYADLQDLSSSSASTPEIVLRHAMAAFNLINDYVAERKFDRAEELYEDLQDLSSSSASTPEIVLRHAMAAFNLINDYVAERKFDRAEELYEDLQDLSSSSASTPEIVLRHAKSAVNLINGYGDERKFDRAEELYEDLQDLSSSSASTPEIVLHHAMAAFNLSVDYRKAGNLDRAEELYADMRDLSSSSASTPEIILHHAKAAFNLINDYGEARKFDRAEELYADLKDLSLSADSTPEIVLHHAMAAFNLINAYGAKRQFDRAEELYADLQDMSSSAGSTPEIALEFAKAAFNLMAYYFQQEDSQLRVQELYANLKALSSTHATPEIEMSYIKGTAIMVLVAHEENNHKSANQYLSEFRNMCKKYPDNPELLGLSEYVESQLK